MKKAHDVCFFQGEGKLVVLHLPELQQLVNETEHALGALVHHLQ